MDVRFHTTSRQAVGGGPARYVDVMGNGRSAPDPTQGLARPLRDGDKIDVFRPVGGDR